MTTYHCFEFVNWCIIKFELCSDQARRIDTLIWFCHNTFKKPNHFKTAIYFFSLNLIFLLFTAILCPLHFQVNFESTCQFPQHNSENYYCHCIDSVGHFGMNWHLSNIESFSEHGMLLHLFGSSSISLDTVL